MNISIQGLPRHLCWILIASCLSLPSAWSQAPASLAEFLDESGRLVIPEGFSGSLDPQGFEMMTASDGTPYFLSERSESVVPGDWESFGGVSQGCDGEIWASTVSSAGLIYFGGLFSACEGVVARNVVSYNPSTKEWHSLGNGSQNGVGGQVLALEMMGDDLYVGGRFPWAGNQLMNNIARWDGSQWHVLFDGNQIGVNGGVAALASEEAELYVGGEFTSAGGLSSNYVARWSGADWHRLGSETENGVNGAVYDIKILGDDVYLGGQFTEAGGSPANYIAMWDGFKWHTLGSGNSNGLDAPVEAIAISGSDVYVGGWFHHAGGSVRNGVARWNGKDWHSVGPGNQNGVNGIVYSLTIVGDDVYAGGNFNWAGQVGANGIGRWDGNEWQSLGEGENNGVNIPEQQYSRGAVLTLLDVDGEVISGGVFANAGGQPASNVAWWNGFTWASLGAGGQNGINGPVNAVLVSGTTIFVGGLFSMAGDVQANNVARWEGDGWHPLETGSQDGENGVNGEVFALEFIGGALYVGGSFSEAGGLPANNIAVWTYGNFWASLGSGVNGRVRALVYNNFLFAGGDFSQAGGVTAHRIARWDGLLWNSMGSGTDGRVNALAVADNGVYVGGQFTHAGGISVNNIARAHWAGNLWEPLGDGEENGVNMPVTALEFAAGVLYVGGFFNAAGGLSAQGIAMWTGQHWSVLESGAININAIAVLNDDLYIGGSFGQAGDIWANSVARWDGEHWASLGIGSGNGVGGIMAPIVSSLAVRENSLVVGGGLTIAGGQASSRLAIFSLSKPLVISASPSTVLIGHTSELSVKYGLGSGSVSVDISQGAEFCSLSGMTLAALAEGICTVTATKAADGQNLQQITSTEVRVVTSPGVHLQVELEEVASSGQQQMLGLCDVVTYRVRVRNNGPLPANQVRLQMPVPTGLLSQVDWICDVPSAVCSPASGQGAIETDFPLDIGKSAEISINACPDPNAAFADFSIQASLPDGTPLVFPNEAQLNWSAPINDDGLFRGRFE
jgi:trimeric autotransporter adhesin